MTVPSKPQRPYSQIKPHKKFTPQDQMKQINKYIQKLTEKRNTPRPQVSNPYLGHILISVADQN